MNEYRQLFDDAIGVGEPSSVDIAGIITRQRRRSRLRNASLISLSVVAVMGVATLVPAGLDRLSSTPAPAPRPAASGEPDTAAEVLHAAALAVVKGPHITPRPNQFILDESFRVEVRGSTRRISRHRLWVSVDGKSDGLLHKQDNGGPWTTTLLPGCPDGSPPGNTKGPGNTEKWGEKGDTNCPDTGYKPDPDLPTEPKAMLAHLYATNKYRMRLTDPGPQDYLVFEGAQMLLYTETPFKSPEQTAALYEAMAMIPGITMRRDMVNPAGCRGFAFSVPSGGPGRDSWTLIDAKSGAVVGSVGDSGRLDSGHCETRTAVVDRAGEMP